MSGIAHVGISRMSGLNVNAPDVASYDKEGHKAIEAGSGCKPTNSSAGI